MSISIAKERYKPGLVSTKMQPFDFESSTRTVFGDNTIDQLGYLAKELGGHRVLLVTDSGIKTSGHLDRALQSLKQQSLDVFVFDRVEENPTTRHVEDGLHFAKESGQIDLIVALGGGSSMDCAKGINFLLTNGGKMEDYWGKDKASRPMLPSIGIPTTAGTGSEAQSYALIEQERTHRKMACGDKKAKFQIVILDPVITITMPAYVTAVTGMDAITHAVESYVTTQRNPLSQMYAREAWRLLVQNFEIVLKAPGHLEARSNMLLGSYFAGAAIEYSMLGAAHACANPLTSRYAIHHGVAVSLMLPHVIRYNASLANAGYGELLQISGLTQSDDRSAAEQLVERIVSLRELASLPVRLQDCGVQKDSIPTLAKEASEQWTGKFNPRPLTEIDFLQLYEAAF